jgi:hypothetical protein
MSGFNTRIDKGTLVRTAGALYKSDCPVVVLPETDQPVWPGRSVRTCIEGDHSPGPSTDFEIGGHEGKARRWVALAPVWPRGRGRRAFLTDANRRCREKLEQKAGRICAIAQHLGNLSA